MPQENILAFVNRMRSNLDEPNSVSVKKETELPADTKENRQTTLKSESTKRTRKRAITEAASDEEDMFSPGEHASRSLSPPATRRNQKHKDTAWEIIERIKADIQRLRDLNAGYNTWEDIRDALSMEYSFGTGGVSSGISRAKKPRAAKAGRGQAKASTPLSEANEDDQAAPEADDDLFSLFSDSGNEEDPIKEEASTDEEEEDEKPSRRKKQVTNIRRPANRFNLYVIFNKMMRKKIAEENPDLDRHMLSRLVSERYRAMTPEEKENLLAMRQEGLNTLSKQLNYRPRNQRTPPQPYILYNKEESRKLAQEHPEYTLKDRNAILSARWKAMSAEEKDVYTQRSKALQAEFMADPANKEFLEKLRQERLQKAELRRKARALQAQS